MSDEDIRATLEQHWSVSPTEDWHTAVERTHRIYDEEGKGTTMRIATLILLFAAVVGPDLDPRRAARLQADA
jgi:hypothetical protein